MEGNNKHNQFFRFSSPVQLNYQGESASLWLVESIQYIDFDIDEFFAQVMLIGEIAGNITYDSILHMEYSDFLRLWKVFRKLTEKKDK